MTIAEKIAAAQALMQELALLLDPRNEAANAIAGNYNEYMTISEALEGVEIATPAAENAEKEIPTELAELAQEKKAHVEGLHLGDSVTGMVADRIARVISYYKAEKITLDDATRIISRPLS